MPPEIDTPTPDAPPVNGIKARIITDTPDWGAAWSLQCDLEHEYISLFEDSGNFFSINQPLVVVHWQDVRFLASQEELCELGGLFSQVLSDWIRSRKTAGLIKGNMALQKKWLVREQRRLMLEREENAT